MCDIAGAIAQKKEIEIHTEIAAELDRVTLDQQKFKQVLYNLVANGIKFTDPGGRVDIVCSPCDRNHFKYRYRILVLVLRRKTSGGSSSSLNNLNRALRVATKAPAWDWR